MRRRGLDCRTGRGIARPLVSIVRRWNGARHPSVAVHRSWRRLGQEVGNRGWCAHAPAPSWPAAGSGSPGKGWRRAPGPQPCQLPARARHGLVVAVPLRPTAACPQLQRVFFQAALRPKAVQARSSGVGVAGEVPPLASGVGVPWPAAHCPCGAQHQRLVNVHSMKESLKPVKAQRSGRAGAVPLTWPPWACDWVRIIVFIVLRAM